MIILRIHLKVIGKFGDLLGKHRDLHISGAGIGVVCLVLFYDVCFCSFCKHRNYYSREVENMQAPTDFLPKIALGVKNGALGQGAVSNQKNIKVSDCSISLENDSIRG